MDASQGLMRLQQETSSPAGAGWQLGSGEVERFAIGPGPRRIEVQQGWLWITRDVSAPGREGDLWLGPGMSADFRSGDRLLLQAWPSARFTLLVPPSACPRRGGRERLGWWSRIRRLRVGFEGAGPAPIRPA